MYELLLPLMKNIFLLFIAIITVAATSIAQTIPPYVPSNGLVGWWPFNGNANDESGFGNNGTVTSANLTSDRFGNANSAYYFDGTDDNINIPNPAILNFPLGVSFTVSFYYLADFTVSVNSGFNGLVGRYYDYIGPANGWQIGRDFSNLMFEASVPCGNNNIVPLSFTQWVHILQVYDRTSGIIYTYYNGNIVDSINCPSILSSMVNNYDLKIGVESQGYQFSSGKIDDIGIWNRALTQSEITGLYLSCVVPVSIQPVSQTVYISDTVQFVIVSPDTNVIYQWQTDTGLGFQNLTDTGLYSGTTNDTLIISNVTLLNNSQPFRCVVDNGTCSDTSAVAILTVLNNVMVNESVGKIKTTINPNPFHERATLTISNYRNQNYYLRIYNSLGKNILEETITDHSIQINRSSLADGIYFYQLISFNGVITNGKFIIE